MNRRNWRRSTFIMQMWVSFLFVCSGHHANGSLHFCFFFAFFFFFFCFFLICFVPSSLYTYVKWFDWPGLCLFCCYQPSCVSEQSWFCVFLLFCNQFSILSPLLQLLLNTLVNMVSKGALGKVTVVTTKFSCDCALGYLFVGCSEKVCLRAINFMNDNIWQNLEWKWLKCLW